MTQNVKDFLSGDIVLDLVDNNKWQEFYDSANDELSFYEVRELTDFLENDIGVNPLEFMKRLPGCYYAHVQRKSVVIPDHIETIDDGAFTNSMIGNVYLPKNLKSFTDDAFYDSRITTVHLPYSTKEYIQNVTIDACNGAYNGAFKLQDPTGPVTEVTVPAGITNDFSSHFQDCTSLRAVKFEEGVDNVAPRTFSGCCGITKIEFPHSMEVVGKESFSYLVSLHEIVYNGTYKEFLEIQFSPDWLINGYTTDYWFNVICKDGIYNVNAADLYKSK